MKNKILIIGSGGLQIGQSGEFDFSGNQAIKAFNDLNYDVVVLNPNIATVQTDIENVYNVYLLPLTRESVEHVLKQENPKYVTISFGGQTALNLGIECEDLFKKYNCRIIGTDIGDVKKTENRYQFTKKLENNNIPICKYIDVKEIQLEEYDLSSSFYLGNKSNKSWFVRTNNTLGGLNSQIIKNQEELNEYINKVGNNDFILEENITGWKELEFEILRDKYGNSIAVCSMENMDPMGIHTGESIVVAPIQTLEDPIYQELRTIALKIANIFDIIGECNVQFALSPDHKEYRVIEINARLSRSSALASKATGYPIAYIAAKLQLGMEFGIIKNPMTGKSAFYEPSLDYIVCKFPKWDFEKFGSVNKTIGSSMKSVGEVMAIGKNFEEVLQKSIRMLGMAEYGLLNTTRFADKTNEELEKLIKVPNNERIFALYEFFRRNDGKITTQFDLTGERINNNWYPVTIKSFSVLSNIDILNEMTGIDKWFLYRIQNIYNKTKLINIDSIKKWQNIDLNEFHKIGCIKKQLSQLCNKKLLYDFDYLTSMLLGRFNDKQKHIKLIDTTAGEYPAKSNYCYLTKNGIEDDVDYDENKKYVIVLGSGPYKIGSSVEFDWCCVSAIRRLKKHGYSVIVLNNNPETVSTDYDECDIMVFDEINVENVQLLYEKFNCEGVFCSFGGQLPINLVEKLTYQDINIFDANFENLRITEDRFKLYDYINENKINVKQPALLKLKKCDLENVVNFIKYPIILKPSFILSGDGMFYISNEQELKNAIENIKNYDSLSIIEFIKDAEEIEHDGVCLYGNIICDSIAKHVENAGIHSGDSTISIPGLYDNELRKKIYEISKEILFKLKYNGPFNIQYMIKENLDELKNDIYLIEINLRASRTFPLISKYYKYNFVHAFVDSVKKTQLLPVEYFSLKPAKKHICHIVKSPTFSYHRISDSDPFNIIKMNSTGEIACISKNYLDALQNSMECVGYKFNGLKNILISTGDLLTKDKMIPWIEKLLEYNINVYCTPGTYKFMTNFIDNDLGFKYPVKYINWEDCVTQIKNKQFDLVLNIPKNYSKEELEKDYNIRRSCIDNKVPLITDANLFADYVFAYSHMDKKINDEGLRYHKI